MSTFTDLEKDAASVDGFVNENGLIPTRRNGPKPSWQYLVDGWNAEIAAAILEMNKSRGFRVVGTFADGFTYELFNDVGIDADGNSWIYVGAGAPNKIVAAGTVPSVSAGYQQVTFNALQQLTGLDQPSELDRSYTRVVVSVKKLGELTSVNNGDTLNVLSFYEGKNKGGSVFMWDSSLNESEHNGYSIIAMSAISAWDGTHSDITSLYNYTGTGQGCFVKVSSGYSNVTSKPEIDIRYAGGLCDSSADDSEVIQHIINTYSNGVAVIIDSDTLISGISVKTPYVTFKASTEDTAYIVKSGSLGFNVEAQWVSFDTCKLVSQGSRDDGLNTSGAMFNNSQDGNLNSIGYSTFNRVTVRGFSGYGVRYVNAINVEFNRCFIRSCFNGVEFRRDDNDVLFSTTVNFQNVYITSCSNAGILGDYVYRSSFNIIGEYCKNVMDMYAGDFTLYRCYFEKNLENGVKAVNATVQDLFTYVNDTSKDSVNISFETGVIAASDRGYMKFDGYNTMQKEVALLSEYGTNPVTIKSYGGALNKGIKYGDSCIAMVRGDNLFMPELWESDLSSEFRGWSVLGGGYEISGTVPSAGYYGIRNTVELEAGKNYVIDIETSVSTGNDLSVVRVGSETVKSGQIFTVDISQSYVIRFFATAPSGSPFNLLLTHAAISEVTEHYGNQARVSTATGQVSRQRSFISMENYPATGKWGVGEIVYNSSPVSGGYLGWVCVDSVGSGTWKGFGLIEA